MREVRSTNGGEGGSCRVLVIKVVGKRSLGRSGRRLEVKIKMDLQEVGWERGLDWSGSEW